MRVAAWVAATLLLAGCVAAVTRRGVPDEALQAYRGKDLAVLIAKFGRRPDIEESNSSGKQWHTWRFVSPDVAYEINAATNDSGAITDLYCGGETEGCDFFAKTFR